MKNNNLTEFLLRWFLRYLRSSILAFVILPIVFSLFFIATAVNQADLFGVAIAFLARINFIKGNSLNGSDIMIIFFNLSLVFFVFVEIAGWLSNKLFHKKVIVGLKVKLIASSVLIVVIYAISLLLLPFAPIENNDVWFFRFFIIFFGLVSLFANLLFHLLNEIMAKIDLKNIQIYGRKKVG